MGLSNPQPGTNGEGEPKKTPKKRKRKTEGEEGADGENGEKPKKKRRKKNEGAEQQPGPSHFLTSPSTSQKLPS